MKHIALILFILSAVFFAGCFEVTENIKNDQAVELLLEYSKYGTMQYSVGTYDISYRDYWGAFTYGDVYRKFGLYTTTASTTMLIDVAVSNTALPGTYNQTDKDSVFIITYDDDVDNPDGYYYELAPGHDFIFMLEQNGPFRVKGTFSGELFYTDPGSPLIITLSNGTFDLPYRY